MIYIEKLGVPNEVTNHSIGVNLDIDCGLKNPTWGH